jgi:hypothetical protein
VVAPVVAWVVHRSVWEELEVVTGVLAALMFAYFAVILHQGIRFTKERRALIDWPRGRPTEVMDALAWSPDVWFFTEAGAESGVIGLVVGVILDIVAMIILTFLAGLLLWLGANAIVAIVLFLFWVHARWLRYLVTTGRHCRGRWARSLLHSGFTTVRFAMWFYLAFFIARKIGEMRTQ